MNKAEQAYFGGGCFWCTETIFKSLKGVISATSGYSGGESENPTYEEVSEGEGGHAETVKIEYDPQKISYEDLLSVFFNTHDPTTPDRQGPDVGSQYRSVIFYTTEKQKEEAEKLIKELNEAHTYDKLVITEVAPFKKFFEAEDYHKNYYESHKGAPYCEIVIAPKLEKLQRRFANLLKSSE
jgi:peptide-methionine (S)-S-oxide reductase